MVCLRGVLWRLLGRDFFLLHQAVIFSHAFGVDFDKP